MYATRKPERPNLILQLLEDRRAAADDRQVQVWPIRHERGDGLDEMAVAFVGPEHGNAADDDIRISEAELPAQR